jgi:DNA helicase-2/ATP-dependent DNA helicase PcrA
MKRDIFKLLEQNRGIHLNPQQQAAALHYKGPGAVLAVPGSGKTTVLMTRTANLIINHGIRPENILTITFNRAAVLDMQSRFHSIFGRDLPPMNFSTIHAFALSVLKSYCRRCGRQIKIIEGERSEANKSRILKAMYREVNGEFPGEDKLEELSRWIGYIKNMMLEGPERDKLDIKVDGFKDIFEKYEAFKKEKGFIDFDDMLTNAYTILKEDTRLLSQCRLRYSFVQVDEFQDNSKIQNELIRLIAGPLSNLFVVADDDQCIYGFRGACPQAVLDFNKEYPGAKTFFMEQNFRSLKDIVELSNVFIKGNLQRYNKSMYTEKTGNGIVQTRRPKDEEEQLDLLVRALKEGVPSETAILFRNNLSAVTIADRLMREGVPFYIKDRSLHFFKHWVTEDILSFLKLALNPLDMESFRRIYYKCGCYISREAVDQAEAGQGKSTVYDALRGAAAISAFNRVKIDELEASVRSLGYKNPEFALEYIENDIGYRDYITENGPKRGYSIENLKSILESLKTIARHTTTLTGFMERLETLQQGIQEAALNRNYNGVTLSTLHSSKGLEFESVYIADLAKGIFPPQSASDQQEKGDSSAMEEERRLFYVGMTRAKGKLVLLYPRKRNGEFSEPSVFVRELCSIMSDKEGDTDGGEKK